MRQCAVFDIRFVRTCMTCNPHIPWKRSLSNINVTQHCPAWTAALPMTPGCVGMAYIHWQGACAGLDFRGDIFHHYHLPGKQCSSQPPVPPLGNS